MPLAAQGSVVGVGNFDGVHKGHQKVLQEGLIHAKESGLPFIVVTFEPHPRQVLSPDNAPKRLTGFAEKCRLLKRYGVEGVYVVRFTKTYAQTPPEVFMRQVFKEALQAKHVVVGYDFAFGKNRTGGTTALKEMGKELGYNVSVVAPQEEDGGGVYSSSRVRQALLEEDFKKAKALLGHTLNHWKDKL